MTRMKTLENACTAICNAAESESNPGYIRAATDMPKRISKRLTINGYEYILDLRRLGETGNPKMEKLSEGEMADAV